VTSVFPATGLMCTYVYSKWPRGFPQCREANKTATQRPPARCSRSLNDFLSIQTLRPWLGFGAGDVEKRLGKLGGLATAYSIGNGCQLAPEAALRIECNACAALDAKFSGLRRANHELPISAER
jgi:hypothetical protein